VLDGLGATRMLRAAGARVPIIAVSGNARAEWADRAREAGMDGFVRKPYGRPELAQVLDAWRRTGRT
jgi:CheY-like chemotaxis protein